MQYNESCNPPAEAGSTASAASEQGEKQEVLIMLNEAVKKVLAENMWDLATCADGNPNVVPVAFKEVLPDGTLAVGDVFLETTLENLRRNHGKIAVSVYHAETLEGYQIKGHAEYRTEGPVVEAFQKAVEAMFHGAATAKGALLITPETVIVTTPGGENKKVL